MHMKTISCYHCEATFEDSSRDSMLAQLYDHYMKEHKAVIEGADEAEKKRWMEQFDRDWNA